MRLQPPKNAPVAEVETDSDLVRRLLHDQHPDLAQLPIRPAAHGWDNDLYRLGDELCVRLPRRAAAAQLVLNEQRWLPELAQRLPLPIPVPLYCGAPGHGYPWAWSVCSWLPGTDAFATPPTDPSRTAECLAEFLRALHQPAPAAAPPNPVRGGPLATRREALLEHLAHVDGQRITGLTRSALARLWETLEATPPWSQAPVWVHGDLHLFNVLVHRGKLAAVLDFGDLTAGDPAVDLAIAWMLFDAPRRERFRTLLETDDATWRRARGWGVAFGVVYLAHAADQPELGQLGERLLREITVDEDTGRL